MTGLNLYIKRGKNKIAKVDHNASKLTANAGTHTERKWELESVFKLNNLWKAWKIIVKFLNPNKISPALHCHHLMYVTFSSISHFSSLYSQV